MFIEFKHHKLPNTVTFNDVDISATLSGISDAVFKYKSRNDMERAIIRFIQSANWNYNRKYEHD